MLADALRLCGIMQINMLQNKTCQFLCAATVPGEDAKFINDRIREDYASNWLVDGLPVAEMQKDIQTNEIFYTLGFELGNDADQERPQLYNHFNLYIECVPCRAVCPTAY